MKMYEGRDRDTKEYSTILQSSHWRGSGGVGERITLMKRKRRRKKKRF
jgi:hypothetical protein